jgi:hypothetical protein
MTILPQVYSVEEYCSVAATGNPRDRIGAELTETDEQRR